MAPTLPVPYGTRYPHRHHTRQRLGTQLLPICRYLPSGPQGQTTLSAAYALLSPGAGDPWFAICMPAQRADALYRSIIFQYSHRACRNVQQQTGQLKCPVILPRLQEAVYMCPTAITQLYLIHIYYEGDGRRGGERSGQPHSVRRPHRPGLGVAGRTR